MRDYLTARETLPPHVTDSFAAIGEFVRNLDGRVDETWHNDEVTVTVVLPVRGRRPVYAKDNGTLVEIVDTESVVGHYSDRSLHRAYRSALLNAWSIIVELARFEQAQTAVARVLGREIPSASEHALGDKRV